MSRTIIAAGMLAAVLIGACSPAVAAPPSATPPPAVSPSPSVDPTPSDPAEPTVQPSPTPAPTADPTERPDPTPKPKPTPKPTPKPPRFTADEHYLLDGIIRGAIDCEPVRAALPDTAIAGIECDTDDPTVARVGFYLFEDDETMLRHYFSRMAEAGVLPDSGDCHDGFGEGPYFPGEEFIPERNGCFVNEDGRGNYRITLAGDHVYIGILGRNRDTMTLIDYAFRFNQDVPGMPTLWGTPR